MAVKLKRRTKTIEKAPTIKIKKKKKKEIEGPVEFLSSGCTTLNLVLSGKAEGGGWARARINNVCGARSSGKTAIALEAAFWFWKNIKQVKSNIFPKVKNPIIVYNNIEAVMDFNLQLMYGKQFPKAIEWIRSPHVEAMGRDYERRISNMKKGDSLLYIVDTLDFLRSYKSIARFKESVRKDGEIEGSYDTEKQKFLSAFFGITSEHLKHNTVDATLMIVSQVRHNLQPMSRKKYYRAGGSAFDHAVHQELWLNEKQKVKATKFGEKRVKAIEVRCWTEKNKTAPPFRESNFTILYNYGIDDLTSMIDYVWAKKQINFDGQKFKTKKSFIKFIEENNYEHLVAKKAEEKWQKIENAFNQEVAERKRRW